MWHCRNLGRDKGVECFTILIGGIYNVHGTVIMVNKTNCMLLALALVTLSHVV